MAVSSAANAACVTKLAYYVSITGSKYKKKNAGGRNLPPPAHELAEALCFF
jgi:hypothetical protein